MLDITKNKLLQFLIFLMWLRGRKWEANTFKMSPFFIILLFHKLKKVDYHILGPEVICHADMKMKLIITLLGNIQYKGEIF